MRRYNRRLFRIAHGILKNAGEAEDAVQEAYVRVFTRIDQLDDPARFGAWLAKVAANEALQRRRRPDRLALIDDLSQSRDGQSVIEITAMFAEDGPTRSEEHTSELQSLMRISYAVFCLKKKKKKIN